MSTPHNSAKYGQFAKTVLMPGDPLRAKWIASSFLEEAALVTRVRNVYGYTGKYKGERISVMASGMGMPSIGIYSYELYQFYGVENIIRIGSAGAYSPDIDVMDLVLADSAWSESSYAQAQNGDVSDWKYPSSELNDMIVRTAADIGKNITVGPIHSSDVFYREKNDGGSLEKNISDKGLLCVEMESFALFHNASVQKQRAACLLTISDSFVTGSKLSADSRVHAFNDMAELAMESAYRFQKR